MKYNFSCTQDKKKHLLFCIVHIYIYITLWAVCAAKTDKPLLALRPVFISPYREARKPFIYLNVSFSH